MTLGARLRRHLPLAIGLLVLAGVIAQVRSMGDPARFAALLTQADPAWFLLAVGLQLGTYVCAASVWTLVLHQERVRVRLPVMFGLAVGKLFVDQVLPSGGIGGSALVVRGLHRRGAPLGLAMSVILVDLLGFYLAHAISIAIAATSVPIPEAVRWAALAFGGLALFVPGCILFFARPAAPAWAARFPIVRQVAQAPAHVVRNPRLVLAAATAQLGIILLDAWTLQVMLRAIGVHTSLSATWAAYVLAHVVAIVGVLPAGLGLFEGASVATLSLVDIPVEAGLGATLLLRTLTLWLPLLPGLWFATREGAETPVAAP